MLNSIPLVRPIKGGVRLKTTDKTIGPGPNFGPNSTHSTGSAAKFDQACRMPMTGLNKKPDQIDLGPHLAFQSYGPIPLSYAPVGNASHDSNRGENLLLPCVEYYSCIERIFGAFHPHTTLTISGSYHRPCITREGRMGPCTTSQCLLIQSFLCLLPCF